MADSDAPTPLAIGGARPRPMAIPRMCLITDISLARSAASSVIARRPPAGLSPLLRGFAPRNDGGRWSPSSIVNGGLALPIVADCGLYDGINNLRDGSPGSIGLRAKRKIGSLCDGPELHPIVQMQELAAKHTLPMGAQDFDRVIVQRVERVLRPCAGTALATDFGRAAAIFLARREFFISASRQASARRRRMSVAGELSSSFTGSHPFQDGFQELIDQ